MGNELIYSFTIIIYIWDVRMFCMITTKTTPGDTGGHHMLYYILYIIYYITRTVWHIGRTRQPMLGPDVGVLLTWYTDP